MSVYSGARLGYNAAMIESTTDMDLTIIGDAELERLLAEEAEIQAELQRLLKSPGDLQFAPSFSKVEPSTMIRWV